MKFIDMVTISKRIFISFIDECNRTYRQSNDLKFYRDIIELHKINICLSSILENEIFYKKVHDTLIAWNMNQRGAKLASKNVLRDSILSLKNELVELENLRLQPNIELKERSIDMLKKVFLNLKVMESKRKIVGVSKTMHFILPNLIIPIDSTYTLTCFYNYNKYDNSPEKEFGTFLDIFEKSIGIVKRLNLVQEDVDGEKWNTSIPKLIDNAIIGFYRYIYSHDVSEVIELFKSQ